MKSCIALTLNSCVLMAGAAVPAGCPTEPIRPPELSQPVVKFARQTSYGDSKSVETVTNEFGSTDLQMIAEKMVGSLLENPVLTGRPTSRCRRSATRQANTSTPNRS